MHVQASTTHPLTARREAAGYSLRSLAAVVDIHFARLWQFEHGLYPRPDELARLARTLHCTVDDLTPHADGAR